MKAAVGIYDTHAQAIGAVVDLKNENFPVTHLSILAKAETEVVGDDEVYIAPKETVKLEGVEAGTALGVALGVLTGVGVFAIPGFGFLYGAGALVGAIAGFDFGLIGGGIASVLETIGAKDELAKKYKNYLDAGKYLLVIQGPQEEVDRAKAILAGRTEYHAIETN